MAKSFDVAAAKKSGVSDFQIKSYMKQKGLKPKKTVGGFVGNIFKSGGDLVGDTVGAVANIFNPDMEKNTVANLGKVGLGAVQLALPGEQGFEDNARAVGNFYKDRYGSMEAIGDTLYNDPVGVAGDVSALLTGAGGALKGAGALSKGSKFGKIGSAAIKAGDAIDPIYQAGKFGAKGAVKAGKSLEKYGRNYITAGIGNPGQMRDIDRYLKETGSSTTDLFHRYPKLQDRSPAATASIRSKLLREYEQVVDNPRLLIKMNDGLKKIDDRILEIQNVVAKNKDNPAVSGLKSELETLVANKNALSTIIQDNLGTKMSTGDKIVEARRQLDYLSPKPGVIDMNPGVSNANAFTANVLRESLSSGAGQTQTGQTIRRIGADIKALGNPRGNTPAERGLYGVIESAAARGDVAKPLRVSNVLTGGLGGVVGGFPGFAVGMVGENLINSPSGIKAVSRAGTGAGKSFQFAGRNLNKGSNIERMGRVIAPFNRYQTKRSE